MPLNVISIDAAEEAVADLHDFHLAMAKKIWPRGATLVCTVCGRELTATVGQLAKHLRDGWPACCGVTMWVQ